VIVLTLLPVLSIHASWVVVFKLCQALYWYIFQALFFG